MQTFDAEERALLVGALTDAVTDAGTRGLREALAGVGFDECLAEEPSTTVRTVLRLQGSLLTRDSVLDEVVLDAAGLTGQADAVVHPALPAAAPTSVLTGALVDVDGVVDAARAPRRLVVPARGPDGLVLVRVEVEPLAAEAAGMELTRALVPLVQAGLRAEVVGDAQAWESARAAGLRAVACELAGLTDVMLRLAVEHTTSRVQFGRPLASFQVVKHKLADVRVWLEVADLAAEAAFEDGDLVSAVLAKTLAVRASRAAREHCQQVLGGMGFTWEHAFHHHVRRALVLEPLLGSAAVLRSELGTGLLAEGRLPALAPL